MYLWYQLFVNTMKILQRSKLSIKRTTRDEQNAKLAITRGHFQAPVDLASEFSQLLGKLDWKPQAEIPKWGNLRGS